MPASPTIPRILVTIKGGMAMVEAADGPVHLTLVGFDRSGTYQMPLDEIDAEFEGGILDAVDPSKFDEALAETKADFTKNFGVRAGARPRGR